MVLLTRRSQDFAQKGETDTFYPGYHTHFQNRE